MLLLYYSCTVNILARFVYVNCLYKTEQLAFQNHSTVFKIFINPKTENFVCICGGSARRSIGMKIKYIMSSKQTSTVNEITRVIFIQFKV